MDWESFAISVFYCSTLTSMGMVLRNWLYLALASAMMNRKSHTAWATSMFCLRKWSQDLDAFGIEPSPALRNPRVRNRERNRERNRDSTKSKLPSAHDAPPGFVWNPVSGDAHNLTLRKATEWWCLVDKVVGDQLWLNGENRSKSTWIRDLNMLDQPSVTGQHQICAMENKHVHPESNQATQCKASRMIWAFPDFLRFTCWTVYIL